MTLDQTVVTVRCVLPQGCLGYRNTSYLAKRPLRNSYLNGALSVFGN
jgi:hypothetical protein